MSGHRRTLLLAALALTVPLPAFALSQDGGAPASDVPVTLGVSASLAGCGLADTQVVCEISFTFDSVPGATSYTASVTSPDGSVSDVGAVGPGGGTAFVPYSGSGYYSVRVNAYGQPEAEDDGEKKLIATDVSHEVEPQDADRDSERTPGPDGGEPAAEVEVTPTDEPGAPSEEPAPADDCTTAPVPPAEAAPPANTPQPGTEAAPAESAAPAERQGAPEAADAEVEPAPAPPPAAPTPDPCAGR